MLIDWKLGLILLVATPVIALILYMVMSRSVPFYKRRKKLDRISLVSKEKDCQAFVSFVLFQAGRGAKRFEQAASEQTETAIGVGKLTAFAQSVDICRYESGCCGHFMVWRIPCRQRRRQSGQCHSPCELYDANIACTHRGGKFGGYFYKSGGIRFQS